jgi:hypothetical protein
MYNIGLALMRLDHVAGEQQPQPLHVGEDGLLVKPFIPEWWPSVTPSPSQS